MILSEIQRFLNQIFVSIDWDIVFFVGIGFQILLTVFFIVKSHYAYEMRVVKKLVKLNSWLSKYQYIDSNNLLEFNDLMKKTPKLLRYYWHQYMLYREKEPSFYMSAYNCIEKPLKTSSFKANIKNYILISYCFAIFMFAFGIIGLGTAEYEYIYLSKAMLTSVVIVVLNVIFVMILRARENRNLSALYQYFHYFNRFMDRAVTTMPPYVDFEVLFTATEIRKGIPVLNEYLEKRARQEQEELEKARLYAVEHETFDFSEAGLNGTLVLDRAMKESETYLNIRQRLLSEIEQFDGEIDSLKRNYENTQREYEKKMQASKENVGRLRKQQEESTNRIESNYIKKQQSDEIKKQEQLEKDHDSATVRFNQEMEVLVAEIDTRKKDLEERRQYVEDAMKAEYQTFSLKMYKSIFSALEDKTNQEKQIVINMKDEIVAQLEEAMMQISEKNTEINELRDVLKKHKIKYAGYGGFESRKLQAETKRLRGGKKEEIDDEFSNMMPNLLNAEQSENKANNVGTSQATGNEKNLNQTKEKQASENQIVYDENGGYFDKEGNYRYKNGAYYDKEGNYHDEKGGWYEADGATYHPPVTVAKKVGNDTDNVDSGKLILTNNEKKNDNVTENNNKENATENINKNVKVIDDTNKNISYNKIDNKVLPVENIHNNEKDELLEDFNINVGTPNIENSGENSEDNSENIEQTLIPHKKPGRPRKEHTDEVKIKRPRGRPKKELTDDEEPKVKRPRGRPKKEQTDDEEPKIKRGRGRPKKEASNELQLINQQIADENSKLKKQQEELKSQLDEALSTFNEDEE